MSGRRCASDLNPTRKCSAVPEPVLGIAGRGVSKIYGTGAQACEVLHGVDFSVKQGEFVALLGGSPSAIIEDRRIPFARPRDAALGETTGVKALCSEHRVVI